MRSRVSLVAARDRFISTILPINPNLKYEEWQRRSRQTQKLYLKFS